jgi:hypothetical protein
LFSKASAIWERAELWVQMNKTVFKLVHLSLLFSFRFPNKAS